MDKIKIGIPRSIVYYYYKDLWHYFFKKLGVEVIVSPKTNKKIVHDGINYTNDEMCLSLKIYMGHINYLKDKCDYILVPRIQNYGVDNQTCTNFWGLYDLVKNIFNVKILNYNIVYSNLKTEKKAFIKLGQTLGFSKEESKKAYIYAKTMEAKEKKKRIHRNYQKLNSAKLKVLLISHPYNIFDEYIGMPILNYLDKLNVEWINALDFENSLTCKLSKLLSRSIYWKFSKELIGAIKLVEHKIDGIIFISSFPCGPDSLVNDLVIRKIDLPYLNIVVDDFDSMAGIETRLESFVDILEQKAKI